MPSAKRPRPGQPTLRDVAARAGVSLGTASNAFNRPDSISAELRDRVLRAARALRYAGPDPAGRRLRTGRSGALGLVFTDRLPFAFADEAAAAFLRGVAEGLEETGTGLLIVPTSPSRGEATRAVTEAAVDGFLVYSTPTGDPRVAAALARRLPVVVVDQPRDLPVPFVGIDDRAGARAAAEHVRDLGHERVAVLAFAESAEEAGEMPFDVSTERLAGYREGLGEALVGVHTCRPNHPATGREATLELLAGGGDRPTAVLAMSDALAAGALQAARDSQLRVPRDLSVVGFDDSPLAALATPPLTTVRQPLAAKGRAAAEALLAAVSQKPPPERTLLATELVVRASTGPPATEPARARPRRPPRAGPRERRGRPPRDRPPPRR